jgi:hypothetical protein
MAAGSAGAAKHRIGRTVYRQDQELRTTAENSVQIAVDRLAISASALGQQQSSVPPDATARKPRRKRTPRRRRSQPTAGPPVAPASGRTTAAAHQTPATGIQPPANNPSPSPAPPSGSTTPQAVGVRYGKPTATVQPRQSNTSSCDCEFCNICKREPSPEHWDEIDVYRDFLMNPVEVPPAYFLLNDVD